MFDNIYDKYILSVNEYRSLTKAAKALGISQPALSSGINTAERKAGIRIFERKRTPIELTPEGRIYLDFITEKYRLLTECQKKITDMQDPENLIFKVGGPSVYAQTIISDAIFRLQNDYPKSHITIYEKDISELITSCKTHAIDCFISTNDELPEGFIKQQIGTETLYLCIPQKWEINNNLKKYAVKPGMSGKSFNYQLLDGQPFIFMEQEQPLQNLIELFLKNYHLTANNRYVVNQVTLVLRPSQLDM